MEEKETIVEEESMSPEEVLVKMKETMVPKEEANKWQKKYNDLFQRVANGSFSGEDKSDEPTEEQLKEAFVDNVKVLSNTNGFLEDRDQVKRLLEFDDYLTSHGRNSCFLPRKSDLSSDDLNRAAVFRDSGFYGKRRSNGKLDSRSSGRRRCSHGKQQSYVSISSKKFNHCHGGK